MARTCVILDDYQNVALTLADWSPVKGELDIKVLNHYIGAPAKVIEALHDAEIVCVMRERTPMTKAVIDALPKLKLIITTGARNASIDVAAAAARGIVVCGTGGAGHPTAELALGLMLDLARNISFEDAQMKAGAPWQTTIGVDLQGKTLGLLGLGKLGQKVAQFGKVLEMNVIAWSQNLTAERAKEHGVTHVSKEELFAKSDVLSIHLILSDRSRGLVGAVDLARMKPTAYLVNTSRGPIVDEAALVETLRAKKIAGAGIDVYGVEPLPVDHPFRKLANVVLTPHLGYVTEAGYRVFYRDIVEDIRAYLDGKPVRVVAAGK
jgi:D-3-phosphoglycerate dehydrogenase